VVRENPLVEVVTREYSYFYESAVCPAPSESKDEKDVHTEKGALLVRIEYGAAVRGTRGSSTGWGLYILQSGKLLFVDFRTETDVTKGWNLGREEALFDCSTTQYETDSVASGLQVLLQRMEDLRGRVRDAAYSRWEERQRFVELWPLDDALSDWLKAKRRLDIPDEVWI